jgi:hypothetical protein
MSDDIVTRLREEYENLFSEWQIVATILPDAADEIERLREELEASKSAISGFIEMLGKFGKTHE